MQLSHSYLILGRESGKHFSVRRHTLREKGAYPAEQVSLSTASRTRAPEKSHLVSNADKIAAATVESIEIKEPGRLAAENEKVDVGVELAKPVSVDKSPASFFVNACYEFTSVTMRDQKSLPWFGYLSEVKVKG